MRKSVDVPGTVYCYDDSKTNDINAISIRVQELRRTGKLGPEALENLRKYFRIKNIYHSNAIEGNALDLGETQQIVEYGLTLTGKPLKDQAEAKSLSVALGFLEDLVKRSEIPITERDIRQLHFLVLSGISDEDAGKYRTVSVKISGSDYLPPGPESVPPQMEEYGKWLQSVTSSKAEIGLNEALLTAVVAHTWFVTIHPFIDGNGRVARLLMNLILMRHGFPIAIISKEDRMRYYDALEESQCSDLTNFLSLLIECIYESLEEYEYAMQQQVEHQEWTKSVIQKLETKEQIKVANKFELWKSAMDLLKGYFRQTSESIEEGMHLGRVYFKDFGNLSYEKFIIMLGGESAKRTWFFRIDIRMGERTSRYLFFFTHPSRTLRQQGIDVSLHIAREYPEDSYNYERLENIPTSEKITDTLEIGYMEKKESFVVRKQRDEVKIDRMEKIVRTFVEEVIAIHFR
jgi:Fic family protein